MAANGRGTDGQRIERLDRLDNSSNGLLGKQRSSDTGHNRLARPAGGVGDDRPPGGIGLQGRYAEVLFARPDERPAGTKPRNSTVGPARASSRARSRPLPAIFSGLPILLNASMSTSSRR